MLCRQNENAKKLSPIQLVHQLGVFVHHSPQRREEFEKVRQVHNPTETKNLLPLKDVVTRWNSKEAAIARVLRLRATVEHYTMRTKHKLCPRFSRDDFHALEAIQPSLKVFLDLTQTYSEIGAHSYRIIPDLHDAIEALTKIHSKPSVSKARQASSEKAKTKLRKYLIGFLNNNWVCAAFALDPINREEALKNVFEEYSMSERSDKVIEWIRDRLEKHQKLHEESPAPETKEETISQPSRSNKFASSRYRPENAQEPTESNDPWSCYNSDAQRFRLNANETVLQYWKRMSAEKELKPLAMLAKDVLGLAASSTSVERLFSQSGFVLGRRRGALSAESLIKQTSLRMWRSHELYGIEDIQL